MEEKKKYKFEREDARCYTEHDPASLVFEAIDKNDPEAYPAAQYGLPESFSEKAKSAWEYLDDTAFIFEYKGRLVVTDESLYLTEHGDGSSEAPFGFPRYTADTWEEIEAWLEDVADEVAADEENWEE